LEIISITPTLALEVKTNQIKERIIKRIDELKLTDMKYKLSQDIILLVCNMVEHLVSKNKDKKVNKKQLVVEIMTGIYALNPNEKALVENSIEFLHSNRAIKKLSKFYLFCAGAYEYLFKSKKKETK